MITIYVHKTEILFLRDVSIREWCNFLHIKSEMRFIAIANWKNIFFN